MLGFSFPFIVGLYLLAKSVYILYALMKYVDPKYLHRIGKYTRMKSLVNFPIDN